MGDRAAGTVKLGEPLIGTFRSTHKEVLDHGFVAIRNLAGPVRRVGTQFDADDMDPARAARMSFGALDEVRDRSKDEGLTNYLFKNLHTTPIEMIECWIEMKMPIFVARQFVRHRTVSINEISGRYVQLPNEFYVPEAKNVGEWPDNVKQGRVNVGKTENQLTSGFVFRMRERCKEVWASYDNDIKMGIPPEVARMQLPLNIYTHWLWKQNLHNLMHFLSLRVDEHAQWEARQYAEAIISLLSGQLPLQMSMFRKYRRIGL